MPLKISSSEVLTYLNALGYNNINAQQLKEFIQDLKKLIKYEERRKAQGAEGNDLSDLSPVHDIFTLLHSQGTCASRAKTVPKKESVISLQIKKHKCPCHTVPNPPETEQLQTEPEKEKQSDSSGKKPTSRPKSSFIRPTIRKCNRSDPVALYHRYQQGWNRHKVPGEDNRTDLRWAIREKMARGSN